MEVERDGPMMVCIESLVPVRGTVLQVQPSDTVGGLKALYAARLAHEAASSTAAPMPGASEPGYAQSMRLFHEGVELADSTPLGPLGDDLHLCALRVAGERAGAGRLCARWLPLWLGSLAVAALYSEAFALRPATGFATCDRPLVVFLALCGPIILPYALLCSGAPSGRDDALVRRVARYVEAEGCSSRLLPASMLALLCLGWLVLGTVWLFDPASDCHVAAPRLYYASVVAWVFLLLLNMPWLVLLAWPCLLACRSPLAFAIIECVSGGGRVRAYRDHERYPDP